jgi:hypothetical protein
MSRHYCCDCKNVNLGDPLVLLASPQRTARDNASEAPLQPMPQMDYTMIRTVETDPKGMATQTGGINGGILSVPGYKPGAWVNYVNVESIDASVDKAQRLGAKVTKPKSPVPGMGWFAMLTDPQGNAFAMFQQDAQAK